MAIAIPAGISTLLTLAGTAAAIGGTIISTSAAMQANKYQQQVLARQAAQMEENAGRATQAAQVNQQQQDMQTRALIGEQVAAQSASGLKLGGKSQMLTRKAARELGRMDALNIRQAGDVEAYNFRMIAQDKFDELKFTKGQAGSILLSGFLDAASAGITGLRGLPKSNLDSLFGARKVSNYSASIGTRGPWGSTGMKFAR